MATHNRETTPVKFVGYPDGPTTAPADPRYRTEVCVTTRDGAGLAVRDCGPRHAEHTVIFLHGFCLTGASWSHQIDYLAGR
jgi:pimeloyl-ACP methyl ester carboxylesterase